MSDYTRQEDFSVKDALTTGDPNKVIKGSEVDSEFDALVTAVATKIDALSGHTTNDIVYLNSVGKLVDAGILYTDIAQLSGTQTITGAKTFTGATIVPTPTANTHAATKTYVDGLGIEVGTVLTMNPIAGSSQQTQAHGLGATPTFIHGYMECLSAEGNWGVGDRIDASVLTINNASGITTGFDTTNCYLATGALTSTPQIHNRTTSASVAITLAKWKIVITPFLVGG